MDHLKNSTICRLHRDKKITVYIKIDTDKPVDLDDSEEDSTGLDSLHESKEEESTPSSLPELLSESSSELTTRGSCKGFT